MPAPTPRSWRERRFAPVLSGPEVMLRPKAALGAQHGRPRTGHQCREIRRLVGARRDGGYRLGLERRRARTARAATFTLDWIESGGPPVSPPTRRGFGRVVIEKSLAYEVDGESRLVFAADGVRCHVRIPVEHVVDSDADPGRFR